MNNILEKLKGTRFENDVELMSDGSIYFRRDYYPEFEDGKEQWTNYCDVQDDLRLLGLTLEDAYLEHDCLTGDIVVI